MVEVAVVILNYNGLEFLKRFLPVLCTHSGGARVVVADNHSSDDSIEFLRNYPNVQLLEFDRNLGYAGGYNHALSQIKAEYAVLINSDIEVTNGWLEPLIQFLKLHPNYAAVQPKILDEKDRNKFEHAGASGGFLDLVGYPYCRGRIGEYVEVDHGQYNEPIDIFWASGACIALRKELFDQMGGFDADFFAHMEEIDLCWRMHSRNYKVACVPDSVVYHVGGGTLNKTSSFKTFLNFRNGISLLVKNLPFHHLIWILPVRFFLDWAAAFLMWKNNSSEHFFAVFRAHSQALIRIPRQLTLQHRSIPRTTQQRRVFLALDFYFLNRKRFSDLNNTK